MNRACATLQANVLSLVTRDSLKILKDECITNLKRKHNEINSEDNEQRINQRINTLFDVAIDTTKISRDIFNKCQRTVNKTVVERYSSYQHNLMKHL